ncbi:MAG: CBS domain-containing protein [Burkholderiales bacterium]|nr:MAG: CBS domain-containing protein [Burkholderiales bacterium]
MQTVQQLQVKKGNEVHAVGPDASVVDAIRKMAEHDVGALVVLDDDKLVGIFTERHYAREVFLKGRRSPTTPVREIMSTHVMCVRPEETVDECMAVMTDKHVRHLPVLDQGKLIGIVSIGDLVKSKNADQQFVIDQLVQYIQR